MSTETIQFEIVPADCGLELTAKNSLEIAFSGFFQSAAKWKEQAATITDPKLARLARLELKNIRVAAEKKRKELKEDSLRMGKAIDGANNILLAMVVPIEKTLEDIEKEDERRKAQELVDLIESRSAELKPFVDPSMPLPPLGVMSAEQFESYRAEAKTLHDAKVAAAAKVEAERQAKEAAEIAERARIAAENERLKKEAAAKEIEMAREREAAAAKQAEIEAAAAKAKAAADAAAKESAEKAAGEKLAAENSAKLAAEIARKDREAIEVKAAKERDEAQARADLAAAEAQRLADEIAAAKQAEADKIAAEESARAAAAAAPDKEKLIALAAIIRAIEIPVLATKKAVEVRVQISEQIEKFAAWVERKSETI